VARYGGEEFVILLPGANLSDAQETIVRTQRELTTHVFMYDEQRRFITFSGGVTEVRPEDTLESAVARADDAMYRAKHDGKNCVRAG
jgi:diguanylate cyclase